MSLSTLFVIVALFPKVFTLDCKISQPHITLGDNYSFNKKLEHNELTFGWIVEGKCKKEVMVLLNHKIKAESIKIKPTETYGYEKKDENFIYSKEAYFATISKQQLIEFESWSLIYGTKELYGPTDLPKRLTDKKLKTNILMVADMDSTAPAAPTIKYLRNQKNSEIDLILHLGDFAYEIFDDNGERGDRYFEEQTGYTVKIPYIVIAGNHENFDGGELFQYRFRMPGTRKNYEHKKNFYYSFDFRNIHFVGLTTDYFGIHHPERKAEVIGWLNEDLKKARANSETEFIILMTHRPFYCTVTSAADCWGNMYHFKPIEDLVNKYNVELVLSAHVHSYLRTKPVKNFEILEKSKDGPAPVYIIAGHSGTTHFFVPSSDAQTYKSNMIASVKLFKL